MSNPNIALVGGTIYINPTDPQIPQGVVLVGEGRITAVGARNAFELPPDTQLIDCSGRTITAGFWNSHVHFFERKWAEAASLPAAELSRQLQDMLTRFGFTSVFDLSSQWDNTRSLRNRIESGEVTGPRIRSTGEGLVPADAGLPPDAVLNIMGLMKTPLPEAADPVQSVAAARKLLDAGVDGIKLFVSAQSKASIPQAAIQAAAREAHARHKPVFAHPNSSADALAAVRAGVDVLAHTTPRSGPWDHALLEELREHRVALTPTLNLWKYYARHDRASAQDLVVDTAVGQLRAWQAAGGEVLFGTDLGAVEYDPGEEYALMAAAGMNFRQILASLTTVPAARFGESGHLGRVAAGLAADLVVLKDDPSRDIRALTGIQYTIRGGSIVYRAEGRAVQ